MQLKITPVLKKALIRDVPPGHLFEWRFATYLRIRENGHLVKSMDITTGYYTESRILAVLITNGNFCTNASLVSFGADQEADRVFGKVTSDETQP